MDKHKLMFSGGKTLERRTRTQDRGQSTWVPVDGWPGPLIAGASHAKEELRVTSESQKVPTQAKVELAGFVKVL